MSVFGHMGCIQNLYQDYAYLAQNKEKVHFCNGREKISTLNTNSRELKNKRLKKNENKHSIRAFKNIFHHFDLGKPTCYIQSLLTFSYHETEKNQEDSKSASMFDQSVKKKPKFKQGIELRTLNYSLFGQDEGNQPMNKKRKQGNKDQNIYFSDDLLQ